jgi:hypothetical protein
MNFNHTMASMNTYLAKGESCRQTNGLPDGGRTFDWSASVAKTARSRRAVREKARLVQTKCF